MIESINTKKYDIDTKEVRNLKIINTDLVKKVRDKDKKIGQLYSELRAARIKIRRIINNESDPVDICDKAYIILCDMMVLDISRKLRGQDYVKGRQYYYRYLRDNTILNLKQIAYSLSIYNGSIIQDHSTVIHALEEFNNFYATEKMYKKDYDHFCELMAIQKPPIEKVTQKSDI